MTVVSEQEHEAELPERWSAKAKTDVVLRLLRGESVDTVSRVFQVPAHELEAWRRIGHSLLGDNLTWPLLLAHAQGIIMLV